MEFFANFSLKEISLVMLVIISSFHHYDKTSKITYLEGEFIFRSITSWSVGSCCDCAYGELVNASWQDHVAEETDHLMAARKT
jgi:hypothetical protein